MGILIRIPEEEIGSKQRYSALMLGENLYFIDRSNLKVFIQKSHNKEYKEHRAEEVTNESVLERLTTRLKSLHPNPNHPVQEQ